MDDGSFISLILVQCSKAYGIICIFSLDNKILNISVLLSVAAIFNAFILKKMIEFD